ncbi:sensor histidine kinase [Propionicicella superfundia]|uniref:sensor histidine kinase n=1 Tax=Propionicicella superfundia TaxID=348582 RepID=UPI0004226639|nr:HAMP domain-containing sensor histidine kinase [Propionicicella superfundia]
MVFSAEHHRIPAPLLRLTGWDGLDFRGRAFLVAAATGLIVSTASGIHSAVNGLGWAQLLPNVAMALFAIGMTWLVKTTRRANLAYVLVVVGVFMLTFPWLFFTGGGYIGGMPVFFVFALVVTAFMVEGVTLWILGSLLVVLYAACCLVAYLRPELVVPLPTQKAVFLDIVFAITVSGVALAVALHLLLRLHDRDRRLLAQRNGQLRQVDRAKSDFLAIVAHELNTPLAAMRTLAEGIARNASDGQPVARELAVMDSEAERLGRLVGQLLDVARIADGRLDLDLREENLAAIVQQTLRAYLPLCTRTGNTLELARGSASPAVLVDRERVSQVLVNLLANAARHTHEGAITVAISERAGFAELSVRDTGEGMAPEMVDRLFDQPPGYPSGGLRSAKDTGLGLGLQISRHIVTAHGGELTVVSDLGEGTMVACTFPRVTTQTVSAE